MLTCSLFPVLSLPEFNLRVKCKFHVPFIVSYEQQISDSVNCILKNALLQE